MAQAKRKEKSSRPAPLPEVGSTSEGTTPWQKPAGLSRRGWAVLAAVIALINLPILHHYLRSAPDAPLALPFSDTFDSDATVSEHYWTSGGQWRVRDGELLSPGVKNNPLWLKAKLPHNVRIDFDARAGSPEADVRVEIFGDGENHSSGYELVQGGWNNALSAIVRYEETGKPLNQLRLDAEQAAREKHLSSADLVQTGVYDADTSTKVERPGGMAVGRTYHWTLERRGNVLRWSLDHQPFLELADPLPLQGKHHDRFGLSSGEGDVFYDNLQVTALDDAPFPAGSSPEAAAQAVPRPYSDDFDRETLGANWNATDPSAVRIDDGAVLIQNAHNHPAWLTQPIPRDAIIEFDAWSDSPAGDLKVEAWGDGQSFHTGELHAAYTSTGYVFVLGGWNNSLSAIARLHEHGEDRAARPDFRVEPGRHYHCKITRRGAELDWEVDGKPFLRMVDPAPLEGALHQFFAFGDWEAPVHFDNLRITPL